MFQIGSNLPNDKKKEKKFAWCPHCVKAWGYMFLDDPYEAEHHRYPLTLDRGIPRPDGGCRGNDLPLYEYILGQCVSAQITQDQ